MVTDPEQPVDNLDAEVEEVAPKPKRKYKKRATKPKPAAKKAEPKSKPSKEKPQSEPLPTAEELASELKANLAETKEQFVGATIEPARKVVATWSVFAEMAKETASGLLGGFLGNKKRDE